MRVLNWPILLCFTQPVLGLKLGQKLFCILPRGHNFEAIFEGISRIEILKVAIQERKVSKRLKAKWRKISAKKS